MSPDRWQQIEAVFQTAIDLSPAKRASFLAEECKGDAELRAEVERLLAHSDSAEAFIESPVWTDSNFLSSKAKKIISDSLDDEFPQARTEDFTGTYVGPYRLESEIGRGGMGAVYLAERADGEFEQRVAIKLIKRGMDSDFIIRRFRHERQILASFEHPFIARLLDGGTTRDGVPYFVMEYIEGETLYKYCDEQRLDLRDRLKVFQKVCSTLEYAHERQIVHRDIKPSNILINRFGTPKLLDFGIAKILDPNLIHESINPTASLMRMMTPDYASPEQVQGTEVTPASDIYSLGMLLYELLTGHRPYNFAGRSLHEVSRVICEVSPELPSKIVGNAKNLLAQYGGSETAASDARKTSPALLREQLGGNLDNVIMKSLAKDPGERYLTVKQFSEDISRHFTGQTVLAAAYTRKEAPVSPPHISAAENSRALAVLPFRVLRLGPSDDTDDRFLGVGLADALISRLSKVRSYLVRPTSAILGFGDEQIDPIRAGRELNVDYILDGSIKKANDRLRVTVQLLNVAENSAIWATSIDERLQDVFTLEDTLSQKLIEVLLPQLSVREVEQFSKRGTENAEAFEHYLRGRFYFNSFTEDGLAKSFVSYHNAIAADPDYAHAYAGIADYYNWLGIIGVLPPQECFQPAIEAASKAVELDGELSEAHASLGFSLHAGNYDWSKAEHHLRRAIELNPGNATAYVWYSIVLFTEARFVEGLEFARRSIDLDPLNPFNHHNIGWGLYYARRFDEAVTQYEKVVRDFPDYSFGYYGLSKIHRIVGDTRKAIIENHRAKELMANSVFSLLSEAECYAADGQDTIAKEKLTELKELSETRYVSPYQLSLSYCYLRDREKALECLKQADATKEAWLNWMAVEPVFDVIRDDARFRQIVDRIGYQRLFETPQQERRPISRSSNLSNLTTLVIDSGMDTDEDLSEAAAIRSTVSRRRPWAAAAIGLLLITIGGAFVWSRYPSWPLSRSLSQPINFQNPSIVVLPFTSEDSRHANLGVGLADALTSKLGHIKTLQVISASSGRAMVDTQTEAVGRELSTAFIVRGDLNESSTGFKLTAELVRTSDDSVMWTETFEAADGDLFGLQTKLAERIFSSLNIDPLPLEKQQVYKSYTQSTSAYQFYLIGRYQMTDRNAASIRNAIATFSRSLEEDGNFAPAYVGMADAYSLLNLYDIEPPADAYPKAVEFAKKALAIDDDLAEAHASLAYVKFYHERDRAGSELEFRRAIHLNPSYAQAHHWFALVLTGMNRPVEALSEAQIAQRLDPRSASIKAATGIVYFMSGQHANALDECEKALEINEGFVPALKVQRWVYSATNDHAAAMRSFRDELSYSGGSSTDPGWQIIELQLDPTAGDRRAKLKLLADAVGSDAVKGNDFAFAYEIALAYNALKEPQKALDWLERSEAARGHSFNFLDVDPRLSDLHDDPRFIRLARKLNH